DWTATPKKKQPAKSEDTAPEEKHVVDAPPSEPAIEEHSHSSVRQPEPPQPAVPPTDAAPSSADEGNGQPSRRLVFGQTEAPPTPPPETPAISPPAPVNNQNGEGPRVFGRNMIEPEAGQ
ncbi:MAG: hypothetical protein MI757_11305, partial [Pirellulales bacterium]|nr:hypothetical protein [Pirellulales bacterium]